MAQGPGGPALFPLCPLWKKIAARGGSKVRAAGFWHEPPNHGLNLLLMLPGGNASLLLLLLLLASWGLLGFAAKEGGLVPAPTPFCGEQVGLFFSSLPISSPNSHKPTRQCQPVSAQRPYCKTEIPRVPPPRGLTAPEAWRAAPLLAGPSPPGAEGFPRWVLCQPDWPPPGPQPNRLTSLPAWELSRQVDHIAPGSQGPRYYTACFLWPRW